MATNKTKHRNAPPWRPVANTSDDEETAAERLGFTAAGAAGTALIGAFLTREGWAPKTVAGVLAAIGAGLAWTMSHPMLRSLGAGAMSAAGGQLALLLLEDQSRKTKPANANALPPGALDAAMARARVELTVGADRSAP